MNIDSFKFTKHIKKLISVAIILFMAVCADSALSFETPDKARDAARTITISDGISMVLRDARLIKIEISNKDMSFEDTIIALSPLLPHVNLNMTKTYNQYTPAMIFGATSVPMGEKDPLSWGINVYQTLFDFGKNISNYKASTEIFHAKKATLESVKRTVTLEFIMAYFNLLEAEKMISVNEREVDSLTSYLKDMGHLYDQGVIVNNDLLPAKVKLADARQKLIAANNRREVASARLSTILTLSLLDSIEVKDVKMDTPSLPDMEDAWDFAEIHRPEILFFSDQIKSSMMRERAKTVENLPAIFADGGYTYTQNKYMVHQDDAYIKLGAKMNIYDGGMAGAEIMKERYMRRRLEEEKRKLVDDIRYEVKESSLGLKDAIEKLNVAKNALEQAYENVRFYRVKYNNGVATSTDVLEAISLQTKAETNYYSADYELKRSYARLMYSVGNDMTLIYKETEK
ncbi:MAG: TolC family protein [Candidatus Omnitrophota bacterium]